MCPSLIFIQVVAWCVGEWGGGGGMGDATLFENTFFKEHFLVTVPIIIA